MMFKQEQVLPEEELKAAFTVCDTDKSGTISADELYKVMTGILGENITLEEVKKMVKEADTDNSGEIDYNEFVSIMSKLK